MNSTRFFGIILLVFQIFLPSCKDPNEYRVDPAFADYLLRFENEVGARGRTFDVTTNGLIIEFATLKNNTAGLTHYENPIRIEIDRTYWNSISNTAGADLMKENLIFHELGHGLLKRKHLNSTLENGDWKSIMCGGTKVNNRPWNINYKGIRRDYYIEELFNQNTPAPEFSSNQLLVDTLGYSPKLKLNFNTTSKNDFGWDLVDDNQHKISMENGRMRFESKVSDVFLMFAKTSIDIQSDFSYELNLEYANSTDLSGQFGIVFGTVPDGSNGANDPIEYFSINKSKKMYMGNRTWYSFFTELSENQILPNGRNKLKVFKIGDMLYYFINNVYSYCSEIESKGSGLHYGFMVPSKGVVLLDNFSIAQRAGTGVASKVKQSQPVEFEIKIVKSLNQNVINK
ncbi:MAG TPA: hypothetical protein VI413_04640 [Paludibacter sp.]